MLENIAFASFVGGVLYVIFWLWRNDDAPSAQDKPRFSLDDIHSGRTED